jgi:hypothetical protein
LSARRKSAVCVRETDSPSPTPARPSFHSQPLLLHGDAVGAHVRVRECQALALHMCVGVHALMRAAPAPNHTRAPLMKATRHQGCTAASLRGRRACARMCIRGPGGQTHLPKQLVPCKQTCHSFGICPCRATTDMAFLAASSCSADTAVLADFRVDHHPADRHARCFPRVSPETLI